MYYLVQYKNSRSIYNAYCDQAHNTTGIRRDILTCVHDASKISIRYAYKSLTEFCAAHSAVVLAKFTSSKDFYNHYPELLI